MTAWSHLPNAVLIDRVLASAKAHPKIWTAGRDAAWEAAWDAARAAARAAGRDAARAAAWYAAGYAAWGEARYAAWNVAGYAALTLIAWDHSAKFLDMNSNELKMWQVLSEDPAAILLLPAVIAFEKINEMELSWLTINPFTAIIHT